MSVIKVDPREVFGCGIFYMILIGPTIASNLYLALLFTDRARMILNPTRFRLIITRRHVIIRIFITFIVILLFMIPYHFYFYYDSKTTVFICEFYEHVDRWKLHIWPFLHAILFVSLPSILTCISSLILIYNRYTHRRLHKNNISVSARRMERNSVVLLFTAIGILLSLAPTVILQILIVNDYLSNHDKRCRERWKTYKILSYCFLTLFVFTYSFKFYFRLCISRAFQRDLIQLFGFVSRREQSNNDQCLILLSSKNLEKNIEIKS